MDSKNLTTLQALFLYHHHTVDAFEACITFFSFFFSNEIIIRLTGLFVSFSLWFLLENRYYTLSIVSAVENYYDTTSRRGSS